MDADGDERTNMDDKKARDLALPLSEYATISQEATLQQALVALNKAQLGFHRFVLSRIQSMTVTRNGEVVGILRLTDVFAEVADVIQHNNKG